MVKNQSQLQRIAQFNDQFRDVIKGSTFNIQEKGYVMGNPEKVTQSRLVISGSIGLGEREESLFLEPSQRSII